MSSTFSPRLVMIRAREHVLAPSGLKRRAPVPGAALALLGRCLLFCSALALTFALPALADPVVTEPASEPAPTSTDSAPDTAEEVELKELLKAGVAAYREGHYEQAWDLLNQAWQRKQYAVLASVMADVAMKLGRYDLAVRRWAYVARHLPADAQDAAKEAADGMAECKQHVTTLELVMTPREASLVVDDEVIEVDPASQLAWVMPGEHVVRAALGDRSSPSRSITAKAGETLSLELTVPSAPPVEAAPPPSPAPLPAAAPRRESGASPGRTLVLVTGGVLTSAALATGIGFGAQRGSIRGRIDDLRGALLASASDRSDPCAGGDGPPECAELATKLTDHNRATDRANLCFMLSAGLGIATVVTYVLWPARAGAARTGATERRWLVAPWWTAHSHGFGLKAAL